MDSKLLDQIQNDASKDQETQRPANLFLDSAFKTYIKSKYVVDNEEILSNSQIMQMVMALEWFDIPRTSYSDLIEYNPYLTVEDHDKLFYANTQHRIENGITWLLLTLVSNRIFTNRFQNRFLSRKILRHPLSILTGGVATYIFNVAILRTIYLHDLEELGLASKYFNLDLNADMMKDDLKELGFEIRAKHYNLDEIEKRVSK